MKQFMIQLSLDLIMQVLGVDPWDLYDVTTIDAAIEAALWWWYLLNLSRGNNLSTQEVVYYLEVE